MIKITTDSTCDLPERLLEQYDITVFPLGIVKAGKLYHDGVDIRTADIAAHVDAGGEITTTNAVNVADYEDVFRGLAEKYDASTSAAAFPAATRTLSWRRKRCRRCMWWIPGT